MGSFGPKISPTIFRIQPEKQGIRRRRRLLTGPAKTLINKRHDNMRRKRPGKSSESKDDRDCGKVCGDLTEISENPHKSEIDGDHGKSETLTNIPENDVVELLEGIESGFSKEDPFENPSSKYDEDNSNDDCIWEDGSVLEASSERDFERGLEDGISVELDISQEISGKVPIRRPSSEEKEIAELVHKTHLLCLLGRGRLMDGACDDPLIQASLLSLVPDHLFKTVHSPKLTASCFLQLVSWFHDNFRVRSSNISERSCHSSLVSLLQTREGTPEAVAGLSVSLFRALNLTSRFVSMLDVAPLKPEATKSNSPENSRKRKGDIFSSPTLMIADPGLPSSDSISSESNIAVGKSMQYGWQNQDSCINDKRKDKMLDPSVSESSPAKSSGIFKRKGDLEFELQMEVALAATAISNATTPPFKKLKKDFSNGLSTAMGSKKTGAPIYWSEVFCNGENLTGRWVHVDAVNAIVDGEGNVEAAAAACKKSLRYVVAFSGNGAKDVTRRYCVKWYKIASERVNSTWWDSVLAPLKELESGTTEHSRETMNSLSSTRSSMEDLELITRSLTEPLPTNQQAYRNHQLYAIERWIKKYEVLHPKEPVLGYCNGHPVYPRTCVQKLHTKEMWLREGLQVKADESPAKMLMHNDAKHKPVDHDGNRRDGEMTTTALYGKWQTEPLRLPHAVDGIVPKNDRGQVEVWSEKCLPPGTVQLRYPRIGGVARKLGIDFAPAMVGFEWRKGGSVPVFDGIVLCSEFKDAVMAAYREEEGRREGEEKRKRETDAYRRWYQLLSSLATLRRLNCSYGDGGDVSHRHEYEVEEVVCNDGETMKMRRCRCGFSVQVEEL